MKHTALTLTASLLAPLSQCAAAAEPWPATRAWEWYESRPWLVGCNFLPSTAVNDVEMWQAATFDPVTIDRELAWARGIGFNTVRVFLNVVVWEADPAGLKRRFGQFLDIADRHGIAVMPVLFDDCNVAGRVAAAGRQADPVPGVHNSQWVSSPPLAQVTDRAAWPRLRAYVEDVVGTFAHDRRVVLWDLYNEPGNSGMKEKSLPLVEAAFAWARGAAPPQPLTVGAWTDLEGPLSQRPLALSDVVSFHCYGDLPAMESALRTCAGYGRPVLCTEWMARTLGSRFGTHLEFLKRHRVGCWSWGLVTGRTQTCFPWGSPEGAPMPAVWFHDLLGTDGTPHDPAEVALIRTLTGATAPAEVALEALRSPVLFQGDATTAYRDPAALYHQGWFRLFFTLVKIEPDGRPFSYVAWSKSRDLVNWSPPVVFTPRDQSLNYGSPGNLVRQGDEWVLCLQTYPRPHGERYGNEASRLWTMRSRDLETWGPPELLRVKGPEVPVEAMGRMIDPYLLRDRDDPPRWWCFYKQNGMSLSWSEDLRTWTYAGRTDAGENACVIRDGREYVLFHSPANGLGVKRSADLRDWRDEGILTLGQGAWPWAQGRLTAGFVLDLRPEPAVGKALLFFHGSEYAETDPRGGFDNFASIGLAWSDDLRTWSWPGRGRAAPQEVLDTPPMTDQEPGPGRRVRQTAPEYRGTDVHHALYLPVDWQPGGRYPVLVEYTGNYFPACGSTGKVEGANLGYGLTGGRRFIWVAMPYVEKGGRENAVTWWGDIQATIAYCKVNLPRICAQFGGDPDNAFICGFSRGAIGVSYIGLADGEIAALWKGFITHDHFDGQREWPYPGSDRASALLRLARLGGRPVLVCGGGGTQGVREYLAAHLDLSRFTFLDVPVTRLFHIPEGKVIHPHTDSWMCKESDCRRLARQWLDAVLAAGPATSSTQGATP